MWPVLVVGLGLLFVAPPLLTRGKRGLGALFIPGFPILATGAILFLAYAVASDLFAEDQARQIVIDDAGIEILADGWQRQWQRPPTADELNDDSKNTTYYDWVRAYRLVPKTD